MEDPKPLIQVIENEQPILAQALRELGHWPAPLAGEIFTGQWAEAERTIATLREALDYVATHVEERRKWRSERRSA